MVTEQVSISENSDIESEKYIQKNIQKSSESFYDGELIAARVIKGRYTKLKNIYYKNIEYGSENVDNIDEVTADNISHVRLNSKLYAPVFVLDYNGSHQSFIGNWYKKEESANREIKKLEQYYSPDSMQNSKFSYHIESENTIIHSLKSKDIFKKLRLSNFVHRFVNTDIELLSIVLFGVLTTSYTVGGWKFITNPIPLYLVLLCILVSVTAKYVLLYIGSKNFNRYNFTDISPKEIIDGNELGNKESEYKVVEADIIIDEEGLTIYPEELDCKWFFRRKNNKKLTDSGTELIQNLPISDNTCVITVKKSGYDYKWLSSNEEWQIDTKLSFN